MNVRFPNGKTTTGLIIVTITLLSFLGPMVSFSVQAAGAAVIQPNRTFLLPGAPATITGSSGATVWTSQPYNSPSATPTNYGAGFFNWISSLFSSLGGVDFAAPLIMNVYASSTPMSSDYLVVFEVNPSGAGSASPSDNATYAPGSLVSLVATAGSGYAFSGWTVSDPSAITIDNPSSPSATATINGDGTITANFSPTTVQPASTQVALNCDPGSVAVGASATCSATVTSSVPVTGQTVSWGSAGSGIFDSTSCVLDGNVCSVSYTPTDMGDGAHTITANYVGDAAHLDSSGSFTLTVTAGTVTTETTTVPTTPSGSANIWTDKLDYAPSDTPTIYGTGFMPNANITVSVTRPEGYVNTWFTSSDDSGGFQTTYATDTLVGGTFTVTATDGTNTATTTFTDASLNLSTNQGPVGTVVTLSGNGYPSLGTHRYCFESGASSSSPCPSGSPTFTGTTIPAGASLTILAGSTSGYFVVSTDTTVNKDAPFTVTIPTLALSPNSGPSGTVTTLSGSDYAKSYTYNYCFESGVTNPLSATACSSANQFGTPGSGNIPPHTTLTVSGTTGLVVVSDPTSGVVVASATFTITTATLTLTPNSGPSGTVTTLSGSNYAPSYTYNYCFESGASTPSACSSTHQFTSTAGGAIPSSISLTISGSTGLVVVSDPTSTVVVASATFTVTTPTLTLSATSGPSGTPTTLSGSNYAPNYLYSYCFQSTATACPAGSPTFTSDGTGAIPASVTLTITGTAGTNVYVVVTDRHPATPVAVVSATFSITSANVAPTVSLSGDNTANEGDTKTYTFTVTDPGDTFTVKSGFPDCGTGGSLVAGSLVTTASGGTFQCNFPDGSTSPQVRIQVTDSGGLDSNIDTVTVTVNNVAPTVALSGPSSADEGQTKTYSFTVTDPGVDTFTVKSADCGSAGSLVAGSLTSDASGGSFQCTFPDGPDSSDVTVQVTDSDGADSNIDTVTVTVNNVAPTVDSLTGDVIDENDVATVSGTFSDPGTLDTFTVTINWGEGSPTTLSLPAGSTSFSATHQYLDDNPTGTASDDYTVSVTVADDDGGSNSGTTTVTVNNVAPTIDSTVYPVDPIKVNTPVTFSAGFTDPGTLDTHTARWTWDDGVYTEVSVTPAGSRSVTGTRTFTSSGIYEVTLRITDDDTGYNEQAYIGYIVIYDPNGGFVTGGGWINSPLGAYVANPTLTGKATFGFVSKYQKGANVPTGNTEFQFHAGDLNFKSTAYDWLVVAGTRAQYKGTGTINGIGNYRFMLTAVDGGTKGGDLFRIKIWDIGTGNVVYDNQLGASDTADPTTLIQGGSIVVHK